MINDMMIGKTYRLKNIDNSPIEKVNNIDENFVYFENGGRVKINKFNESWGLADTNLYDTQMRNIQNTNLAMGEDNTKTFFNNTSLYDQMRQQVAKQQNAGNMGTTKGLSDSDLPQVENILYVPTDTIEKAKKLNETVYQTPSYSDNDDIDIEIQDDRFNNVLHNPAKGLKENEFVSANTKRTSTQALVQSPNEMGDNSMPISTFQGIMKNLKRNFAFNLTINIGQMLPDANVIRTIEENSEVSVVEGLIEEVFKEVITNHDTIRNEIAKQIKSYVRQEKKPTKKPLKKKPVAKKTRKLE